MPQGVLLSIALALFDCNQSTVSLLTMWANVLYLDQGGLNHNCWEARKLELRDPTSAIEINHGFDHTDT